MKPSTTTRTVSEGLFARAREVIPGGVNSPVRSFASVGGTPVFVAAAAGARFRSEEGREYLDFCGSWGPLILGHAHPAVIEAVAIAAFRGTSFGTATKAEVELAELITGMIPSIEMLRLVNSGTEAVMTALRIARAATGREKIVKFAGCYHGHSDQLLVAAGSGLLTGGLPGSAGVPESLTQAVLLPEYNDSEAVRRIGASLGSDVAAIIVEPVAGNMGYVAPKPGFLQALREVATQIGAVLIFDEVITGFRFGPTSYGEIAGVPADLTCLGKIIGGGLPIGAVGGRRELMEHLAPVGGVYQAGTLSGNPLAVAAGRATLETVAKENPYEELSRLAARMRSGLEEAAAAAGVAFSAPGSASVFTPFFTNGPVTNLAEAKNSDTAKHGRFFHGMLDAGIYLPPSQFELNFVSTAHTESDIDQAIDAAGRVFNEVAREA